MESKQDYSLKYGDMVSKQDYLLKYGNNLCEVAKDEARIEKMPRRVERLYNVIQRDMRDSGEVCTVWYNQMIYQDQPLLYPVANMLWNYIDAHELKNENPYFDLCDIPATAYRKGLYV